jgi:hypothetical protein
VALMTAAGRLYPTSVRLSRDDLDGIDAVADRTGYSRNEVMRLLLRLGLRLADDLAPKDRRAEVEVRAPPRRSPAALPGAIGARAVA